MVLTIDNSHGSMNIHLQFTEEDLRNVKPLKIEQKVIDSANPKLVSDKLIGFAMMAKSVERAHLRKTKFDKFRRD